MVSARKGDFPEVLQALEGIGRTKTWRQDRTMHKSLIYLEGGLRWWVPDPSPVLPDHSENLSKYVA